MAEPTLAEIRLVAERAARVGGERTLRYFRSGTPVDRKADDTPVTAADREAEALMREVIARAFPDHAILGEEEGETAGTAPYRWIIDPLDGTKTFIRGVPLYGTLVGVEVRGVAMVGAIYVPVLDEMLTAATGEGCTCNGRPSRVSDTARLDAAFLAFTDEATARGRSGAFAHLADRVAMRRTWGDCYGYVLVATGRADIALDPIMNVWDCAALLPIIEEAGGRFTSWRGERTIRGGDAVATNGHLHETVLALLRD